MDRPEGVNHVFFGGVGELEGFHGRLGATERSHYPARLLTGPRTGGRPVIDPGQQLSAAAAEAAESNRARRAGSFGGKVRVGVKWHTSER